MTSWIWTVLIGLFCLSAAATEPERAARKLIIVADELVPFEYYQDGQIVGIDIDLLHYILGQRMQQPFEVQLYPWKRAWRMMVSGEADGSLRTSRQPEREPFVHYSDEAMSLSEYVFFVEVQKKKPLLRGYQDARGLLVGVVDGYSYHPSFWQAALRLDYATTLEQSLFKLALGRIDLVATDRIVGEFTVHKIALQDKIDYYPTVLFSKPYPMAFSKRSTHPDIDRIRAQFDSELTAMKASGEYQKILQRWTHRLGAIE